jgi:hypothetical protein
MRVRTPQLLEEAARHGAKRIDELEHEADRTLRAALSS